MNFNVKVKVPGGPVIEQRINNFQNGWDAFSEMCNRHDILFTSLEWFSVEPIVPAEPPFGAMEILEKIYLGYGSGEFRPMTDDDYQAYADAPDGSMICDNWDGFAVIVVPEETICVEAYLYSPDGQAPTRCFQLTQKGWQET